MQTITKVIQSAPFIHGYTQIDPSGFREIAMSLKLKEVEKGKSIQNYGDSSRRIYILLDGSVSIFVKNKTIPDWEWAIDVYNALKKWKKNVFDKKVRMAMRLQFEQKNIQFELELNRRIRLRFKRLKVFKEPA